MSHYLRCGALLLALTTAVACSDGPLPTIASSPQLLPGTDAAGPTPEGRTEQLARHLAVALGQAEVRAELRAALAQSPNRERKLHFQALLGRGPARFRQAVTEAAGGLAATLAAEPPLELYFPVPEHRSRWNGGADLLVATAIRDGDIPVAFDLNGRRRLLDPARPPATPVLALVPAEQPFEGMYPALLCSAESCGGDPGGSSGSPSAAGGLYMTYASFTGTFESWLKGNPEFETHVMGQDGSSSALKDYQCAGEHAGGLYAYDQNAKTWSGAVLLFSDTQLAAYRAEHPDQAVRVLVVEDDDGACAVKTDRDQLTTMFKTLDALYQLWTGGKDDLTSLIKVFRKATVLQQAYTGIASLIKTNDDVVGTAIEDKVVGQTWAGTNWIVKAKDNVTNGGIRLEMR